MINLLCIVITFTVVMFTSWYLTGNSNELKAIKFTANVPLCGWSKTEFKLGVGPCGLTVDRLKWVELDDRYVLTQYHSDGSRKEFEYLKDDIKGRIEKYLND